MFITNLIHKINVVTKNFVVTVAGAVTSGDSDSTRKRAAPDPQHWLIIKCTLND